MLNSKKFLALLGALNALASAHAFADCGLREICANDRVVHKGYTEGMATVISTNPNTGMVTVRYDGDPQLYSHPKEEYAVAKGCVEGMCVGNRAFIPTYNNAGATVVAVNPSSQEVAVRYDDGGYFMHPASEYTVGHGCVDGICVGDRGAFVNYQKSLGTIVGINKRSKLVTIHYDDGGYYTHAPSEYTITKFCTDYDARERYGRQDRDYDRDPRFSREYRKERAESYRDSQLEKERLEQEAFDSNRLN